MKNPGESENSRRSFLRGVLASSVLLTLARSNPAAALARSLSAERRFAPVKVDRSRIIREVVGLRPYRPQGFVVEAQKVGEKLLVHNYGHGGAGVTLSWGCAAEVATLLG